MASSGSLHTEHQAPSIGEGGEEEGGVGASLEASMVGASNNVEGAGESKGTEETNGDQIENPDQNEAQTLGIQIPEGQPVVIMQYDCLWVTAGSMLAIIPNAVLFALCHWMNDAYLPASLRWLYGLVVVGLSWGLLLGFSYLYYQVYRYQLVAKPETFGEQAAKWKMHLQFLILFLLITAVFGSFPPYLGLFPIIFISNPLLEGAQQKFLKQQGISPQSIKVVYDKFAPGKLAVFVIGIGSVIAYSKLALVQPFFAGILLSCALPAAESIGYIMIQQGLKITPPDFPYWTWGCEALNIQIVSEAYRLGAMTAVIFADESDTAWVMTLIQGVVLNTVGRTNWMKEAVRLVARPALNHRLSPTCTDIFVKDLKFSSCYPRVCVCLAILLSRLITSSPGPVYVSQNMAILSASCIVAMVIEDLLVYMILFKLKLGPKPDSEYFAELWNGLDKAYRVTEQGELVENFERRPTDRMTTMISGMLYGDGGLINMFVVVSCLVSAQCVNGWGPCDASDATAGVMLQDSPFA